MMKEQKKEKKDKSEPSNFFWVHTDGVLVALPLEELGMRGEWI
jgi:hypothetical protein